MSNRKGINRNHPAVQREDRYIKLLQAYGNLADAPEKERAAVRQAIYDNLGIEIEAEVPEWSLPGSAVSVEPVDVDGGQPEADESTD